MLLLLVSALLLCGLRAVHAGNSLHYIYTAFSKPVDLPNIHQFSAVGLLDGLPIDYYDSTTKIKVPKESWMEERLEADYWKKGTESRKTKEQWFQVNLHILAQRLRKNDTVNHVLQWSHGCELSDDNKVRGYDRYSYDGDDFLSFDSKHKQWVAPMSEAVETKRKWDTIQQLNDYTDGYLHKECVDWLQKFMKYRSLAMKNASEPDVYLYAKPEEEHLRLTCFATGFYPKEITMKVRRDGYLLDHADGLKSTSVRPNGDGTHQIKMWVKIPKSDGARYTCEVIHKGSGFNLIKEWDHQMKGADTGGGAGGAGGVGVGVVVGGGVGVALLVVLGLVVGGLVYRSRKKKSENGGQGPPSIISTEKAPLTGSNGSDSGQGPPPSIPTKKDSLNGSNGSDSGQGGSGSSSSSSSEKDLLNGSNGSDSGQQNKV